MRYPASLMRLCAGLVVLAGLAPGTVLRAQPSGALPQVYDAAGLEQRLGESLPLDLVFRDETGRDVPLRTYFESDRPVILTLVYHNCPMLCNVVLDAFTNTMRQMAWTPGQEFEVLTVSFNPDETPALAREKKARYLNLLGKPEAAEGWHFLTGDPASIDALTEAVGFQYAWVEDVQQFVHPAVLTFVAGNGTITRYMQGLTFSPQHVRLSLVETADGTIGSPIDLVALYCLQYDPEANSYVVQAFNLMKLGGLLTVIILGGVLLFFWKRERRALDDPVPGDPVLNNTR